MISKVTLNHKQLLRARMRELSREHGDPHAAESLSYRETLLNLPQWKTAATILLYHPLPGEIDFMPLLTKATGKNFIFPRIEGNHLGLYLFSKESLWLKHPFGLQEPDPSTWRKITPSEIDLAIVPGLAFDAEGARLGRGKGFYDRLLGAADFQGIKIGVCWPWQLLDYLPCEAHDMRMDLVISQGGVEGK